MADTGGRQGASEDESGAADDRVVSSAELFRGARRVVIDHKGDRYVLRITRQNKLILNK